MKKGMINKNESQWNILVVIGFLIWCFPKKKNAACFLILKAVCSCTCYCVTTTMLFVLFFCFCFFFQQQKYFIFKNRKICFLFFPEILAYCINFLFTHFSCLEFQVVWRWRFRVAGFKCQFIRRAPVSTPISCRQKLCSLSYAKKRLAF